MAEVKRPVWETFHGHCSAAGDRSFLLIINPVGNPQAPESIPQCKIEITEENRRKLTNQGIPLECSDDLGIVRSRVSLDKGLELVGVETTEPGQNELTRSYILKKIQEFLNGSEKPGGIIYYSGHGKRNTGDWCFKDGFITFEDITSLYANCFKGRVLTIVTDCSYSGNWVDTCSRYLDEESVQPCGHSANKKGILLKVYASCKPTEVAATPCFSVQCAVNDKNTGAMAYYVQGLKLRETQHSYGVDFTRIRCKKAFEEPCALSSSYTWQKENEAKRVFLVRGKDHGRPAWHYVLLVNDEDSIEAFHKKVKEGTVDVADYGEVLKSGWGKDPPNEIKDWIDQNFDSVYT